MPTPIKPNLLVQREKVVIFVVYSNNSLHKGIIGEVCYTPIEINKKLTSKI